MRHLREEGRSAAIEAEAARGPQRAPWAWPIAWVLVTVLSGCYHPDRTVHLRYEPSLRRAEPANGVPIEVGTFEDRRPREEVGVVSPEGAVLAHARSRGASVSEWVEKALTKELEVAGFNAFRARKGASAKRERVGLRVTGEVLEAEAKLREAISAEVRLKVTLWRDDEPLFTRTYRGSGGVVHVWGTGGEFNKALSSALGNALAEVVGEIRAFAAPPPP